MSFFFNDTATTEIYTLSLHDALPICWGAFHVVDQLVFHLALGAHHIRMHVDDPAVYDWTFTGIGVVLAALGWAVLRSRDRKSTRLNSSHANISYAVFCLKKKQ